MTEFSRCLETAEPSMVRELWKVFVLPGMRSLGNGNPDISTFPVKELGDILQKMFLEAVCDKGMVNGMFSYGVTEGEGPLVAALKKRYMVRYNNGNPETDELQVFTGAQQLIDLATRCFINPGDTVLVEAQSYGGAISAFWGYEAKVKGVDTDNYGIVPASLEKALQTEKNVKMIYVIPTFQNPMGIVTTLERRRAIYDLAVKYNVMILEDSPYFELRYSGEYVPSIKSLDKTGHVIFAGSLSKVVTPGLRLGYAIAHKDVLAKITIAKQCQDLNNPGILQHLAARYLDEYDLDAHIEECNALYRGKRDAMMAALEKELKGKCTWTHPDGGFFVWLNLPEGVSGDKFCKYLIDAKKLLTTCGSCYRPDGSDINAIRLNFSVPSIEDIHSGIAAIGEALTEFNP